MKKAFAGFSADKLAGFLIKCVYAVFFILLFITLFGVVFIGNRLDYYEWVKSICVLDNMVIFGAGVLILAAWIWIGLLINRLPSSGRSEIITTICIALAFVGLYFVGEEVSKCIAFYSGWDVSIVSGTAYNLQNEEPIGNFWYYSVYTNNVPVSYILYRVYDWARNNPGYPYNGEFAWIQLNNILMCIAGFASCMTVKRLMRKIFPMLTCFLLYAGCAFITPWRIIPYTDTMAIAFPILSICLYIYSVTSAKKAGKYIYFLLACLAATFGSLIKPPVLLILFAILIGEALCFIRNIRGNWQGLLIKLFLAICTVLLSSAYKSYIYEETGFIQNKEISATYHHYFLMGLNEHSTGGYYSDDFAMFGQFETAEERIDAEMELAFERLREKGILGYPYFLFKKLVMCFNDGTFGWGKEGGFYFSDFQNLTDAGYKQFLRDIFWPDYRYSGRFNTFSQLAWFIVLAGVTGNILYIRSDKKYTVGTILISLLGIMLYLMLFEARARYLLCFVPVWIAASAMGVTAVFDAVVDRLGRRKAAKLSDAAPR